MGVELHLSYKGSDGVSVRAELQGELQSKAAGKEDPYSGSCGRDFGLGKKN